MIFAIFIFARMSVPGVFFFMPSPFMVRKLLAPYITVSSRDMQPRCLGRGRPHKEERAGAHCSAGEMIKTCHAGWREVRDSNPRSQLFRLYGLANRCNRPLCQLPVIKRFLKSPPIPAFQKRRRLLIFILNICVPALLLI